MKSHKTQKTLVTFYGDDFTGTAASAEALTASGMPTIILTEPLPGDKLFERFPDIKAVGIAGTTRTMTCDQLDETLKRVFMDLKDYRSPVFLYKVCSTFDSSPEIGSIGKAIEIGKNVFSTRIVPVLPAAPRLGRFTVFGHHFAALGQTSIHRLDRHPSMMKHPVTPMNESDLLIHLSKQTSLKSGLINIFDLDRGEKHVLSLLNEFVNDGISIALFDCLYERHLMLASKVMRKFVSQNESIFISGSQELGYGLSHAFAESGDFEIPAGIHTDIAGTIKRPLFVISGSCATVTGEQILWAKNNGFMDVELKPGDLLQAKGHDLYLEQIIDVIIRHLSNNNPVIVHTAIGMDDPRIGIFEKRARALSLSREQANEMLGNALGEITQKVVEHTSLKRLVVMGGDTSGRVQKYLDINALQVAKSIGIAAPVCYAYSRKKYINGMEIVFKGGQIGSVNYLGEVQNAKTIPFEECSLEVI